LPPLGPRDFTLSAPQGFGDPNNSWAWSMQWYQDKLYVGTNRAYRCVTVWEIHRFFPSLFPYPPEDPDLACTPDPSDLPLQAEIWRWLPDTDVWERVFQSANDVPNPDRPGKFLPRDTGFRTMTIHTEADGTKSLYVGGVNTKPMWDGAVPPPRILRTTDGVTFSPVPSDPGTFMGQLPNASFRSLTSYNGQLFVIHGSVQGNGVILASADPAGGNDSWSQVSPEGLRVFEMAEFNGWLYVGAIDPLGGYSVLKTNASGGAPYEFLPVVPAGAYLTDKASDTVVSMHVFNGRLYVGTGSQRTDNAVEIIRINPDDTWELVVGRPRLGPDGWKYPISGLDDSFGNDFLLHIYRMQAHDGRLYVGTYDSSTTWKGQATLLPYIEHLMGFDFFGTEDGWYFTPITTDGFGDPTDFGARNLADTPFGLFLGTTNDYGLHIWRGVAEPGQLPAPARLEAEVSQARPVLSWEPVPAAARYRVLRARLRRLQLPPLPLAASFTGDSISPGIAAGLFQEARFPGPFKEVAVTARTVFADASLAEGAGYLYMVVAEDAQGASSIPSNLSYVPGATPPATFSTLLSAVDLLEQRVRFVSPEAVAATRLAVDQAQAAAEGGDLVSAFAQLDALRTDLQAGNLVLSPEATDLYILAGKLSRRLLLVRYGLVDQASLF